MLADPPKLLLGLFSDQQTPVIGSKVQGAEAAVGAAVKAAEANIVLQRVASKTAGILVRTFLSFTAATG
ncbi:hypothetical protein [Mycobacterium sp. NPDC004974]